MQSAENGFKKHHLIPFQRKKKTSTLKVQCIAKAIQVPYRPQRIYLQTQIIGA